MTPWLSPDVVKGLIFTRSGKGMSELQLLGRGSVLTANRMLFPAGTSLQEAGKSGLRFKKDIPGFFAGHLTLDGALSSHSSMVSSVGAAVCPSKGSQLLGSFLMLGGISQPFYLVFTANSAKACANSGFLTGVSLVPHPWGEKLTVEECKW